MNKMIYVRVIAGLMVLLLGPGIAEAAKTRIGIPDFNNKAEIDYRISDTLVDMLTTTLVQSGKFEVVERTQLGNIIEEQNLGASGAVDYATAARMGKLKGADYMVIGVVTECGAARKDSKAYGVRITQSSVSLAVDIRFVDSTTGSTVFAETFRNVATATGSSTGSSYLDVRAGIGHEMARNVINQISERTMTSVYPPKVIKVDGSGEVYLNYGEVLFSTGERWDVMAEGEALIDPDTGENLGSDRSKVGTIKIISTSAKTSKGMVESGNVAEGNVCVKVVAPKAPPKREEKVNPF